MSSAILTRGCARAAAAAVGLAFSAGCGSQVVEDSRATRAAVVMGAPSDASDDAVVEVKADTGVVINNCSGSLVADKLVLTARHCVAYYVDDTFSCTADGELTPDSKGGQMGAVLDPTKISVHVGTSPSKVAAALAVQVFALQTPSICRNDIALILLDRALGDLPVMPMRLNRGTSPGEVVRFVGYGESAPGTIVQRNTRSGFAIAQVGSSSFRPMGDPVPPRTLVTEGPGGCPGDSGGPILSAANAVVGIFSQVTGTCTASNARDFFTEVAPFEAELLTPAFAAAGAVPVSEATLPGAGGDGPTETPVGGAPPLASAGGQGSEEAVSGEAAISTNPNPTPAAGAKGCQLGVASSSGRGALGAMALLVWLARRRARASTAC